MEIKTQDQLQSLYNGKTNSKVMDGLEVFNKIDKLYYLCNKFQWFTHGSIHQYEILFDECKKGASLERLALIIYICSREYSEKDILEILKQECAE